MRPLCGRHNNTTHWVPRLADIVLTASSLCCRICVGKRHCNELDRRLSCHSTECPFFISVDLLLSAYRSSSSVPAPLSDYTDRLHDCTCDGLTADDCAAVKALLPPVAFYHHHRVMKEQSHALYIQQTSTAVQAGTVVITVDFKQHIKINTAPEELSHVFYAQSLRSVLGFFLVFLHPQTGRVHHQYIDIISSSLTHGATYVLECLDLVVRDYVLPLGMNTVRMSSPRLMLPLHHHQRHLLLPPPTLPSSTLLPPPLPLLLQLLLLKVPLIVVPLLPLPTAVSWAMRCR